MGEKNKPFILLILIIIIPITHTIITTINNNNNNSNTMKKKDIIITIIIIIIIIIKPFILHLQLVELPPTVETIIVVIILIIILTSIMAMEQRLRVKLKEIIPLRKGKQLFVVIILLELVNSPQKIVILLMDGTI